MAGAKLIFIEVVVNDDTAICGNINAKRHALGQPPLSAAALRTSLLRIERFSQMYVTMQDDGSEDDLSYMKLVDYGRKVITGRMHGYPYP